VATIQKRVLMAATQSENNLDSAKMDTLTFTLVTVSDLYNDYACPLNLFDICLLIMGTCQHNASDIITTLWKSVICEEILPCRTSAAPVMDFLGRLKQGSLLAEETIVYGDGAGDTVQNFDSGEWIPRLRNRIATLGKELYGKGSDYTFPLDLLVKQLEGLRQMYNSTRGEDHVSQPWPVQTVLDAGVPFYTLFDSYHSFHIVENQSNGGVDNQRLLWLSNMCEFLELWVAAALSSHESSPMIGTNSHGNSASSQLTQAINTGLLQSVGAYRSSLEALTGENVTSKAYLEERFAKIQETIRRDF